MKYPILVPNIFNHPFTYESSLNLKIGEYVEFELDDNCEGQHNEQAVKVTGIKGKELQCDWVHRLNKKKKFSKGKQDKSDEDETEQ